jgi:3-oxoacyl-ACP reductase-like protein
MASARGDVPTEAGLGAAGVESPSNNAPSVPILKAVTLLARLLAAYAKKPFDDMAIAEGAETLTNGDCPRSLASSDCS